MPSTHVIATDMKAPPKHNPDCQFYARFDRGHYTSETILIIEGSANASWGVCGWTASGHGRRTMGGDMVPGPCASAYGRATVVSRNRELSSASKRRRADAEGRLIRCKAGDVLVLAGTPFTLTIKNRFPVLTPEVQPS